MAMGTNATERRQPAVRARNRQDDMNGKCCLFRQQVRQQAGAALLLRPAGGRGAQSISA